MSTTLDGKALFDEQDLQIEAGSFERASVERAAAGLDGTVSIDLGRRSRVVRQRGVLRAASRAALCGRTEAIMALVDGNMHTLVTADDRRYDHLRTDAFKLLDEHITGAGVVAKYEIVYTQLGS
ncbi:MAG: hypothetical protein JW993_02140 [Sedimentisphaerales bacterium]|nr:hypothetical protein [Sedimentisphaerales bacterium]